MAVNIKTRSDIAANWTLNDPTPVFGEVCLEMDNLRYKVGDGVRKYSELPYWDGFSRPHVREEAGATYQLAAADENGLIIFTNAAGCIITLPDDATDPLPIGYITHLHQDTETQIEVVAGGGAITKTAIGLKTRVQNSSLSLIKQAVDTWKIIGDATA